MRTRRIFTWCKTMKMMKLTLTAMALMLLSSAGWTADDDGEATIRLMGAAEAELPEAVTKEITLPDHLLEADDQVRAIEKAQKGLDKATVRHERREKGQRQAEEARERNTEMSEKAKENRENRGRSEDRTEPPAGPPE